MKHTNACKMSYYLAENAKPVFSFTKTLQSRNYLSVPGLLSLHFSSLFKKWGMLLIESNYSVTGQTKSTDEQKRFQQSLKSHLRHKAQCAKSTKQGIIPIKPQMYLLYDFSSHFIWVFISKQRPSQSVYLQIQFFSSYPWSGVALNIFIITKSSC